MRFFILPLVHTHFFKAIGAAVSDGYKLFNVFILCFSKLNFFYHTRSPHIFIVHEP